MQNCPPPLPWSWYISIPTSNVYRGSHLEQTQLASLFIGWELLVQPWSSGSHPFRRENSNSTDRQVYPSVASFNQPSGFVLKEVEFHIFETLVPAIWKLHRLTRKVYVGLPFRIQSGISLAPYVGSLCHQSWKSSQNCWRSPHFFVQELEWQMFLEDIKGVFSVLTLKNPFKYLFSLLLLAERILIWPMRSIIKLIYEAISCLASTRLREEISPSSSASSPTSMELCRKIL